jgi:hypothetical protein
MKFSLREIALFDSLNIIKKFWTNVQNFFMVPREGIEPSIPCGPRILSPVRIPGPPPRRGGADGNRTRAIAVLQTAALPLRHCTTSDLSHYVRFSFAECSRSSSILPSPNCLTCGPSNLGTLYWKISLSLLEIPFCFKVTKPPACARGSKFT